MNNFKNWFLNVIVPYRQAYKTAIAINKVLINQIRELELRCTSYAVQIENLENHPKER